MQQQTQVLEQCGCSNIVVVDAVPAPSVESVPEAAPAEVGTNPLCYLCGAEGVGFSKPESILQERLVTVVQAGATCNTLNEAGVSGRITPFECDTVSSSEFVKSECGCEIVAPPVQPICYLCGPPSATIANPDSVLSLPRKFI